MNAPRFLRALIAVVPAIGLAACDRQAGTSDEHETTVAARLFQPDGSPASGARIKIYAVADTAKTPQDLVFAAPDGSVRLPTDLPAGEYNLVATDGLGNGLVIDSLLSKGAGAPSLRSDTLRPLGVLTGRLQVEPQHSPRIAWVQILGVGLAANVDTSGNFRLEVPAGRITLAALTREEDYTPTFRAVKTISDSVLDIGTVRLEYTGIPVVEGLTVTYDTLNGVATVQWNRATMPGLLGYEVQWGGYQSFTIDNLSDTVFRDTLFRPETFEDQRKTREYSVVAVDSARKPGVAWRRMALDVPSPWTVPRRGFRIDTTFRIELPENACNVLDTAGEHLVCIREGSRQGEWHTLHFADTAEVRVSRDGKTWTLLPIPGGSLRTVVWKDRIWVVRGIESGAMLVLPHPYNQDLQPSTEPLYDGARVETWKLDGSLERVDSVLDRKAAALYRLMVVSDTLLLSRDSAEYVSMAMIWSGYMGSSTGLRRLAEPGSSWSQESTGMGNPAFEWQLSDRAFWFINPPLGPLMAEQSWNGWDWSRFISGGLFAARPGERFNWRLGSGLFNVRHRGNGTVVPPFVIWKGCVLVQEPAAGKVHGICPEE